jgi:hypothetical protein
LKVLQSSSSQRLKDGQKNLPIFFLSNKSFKNSLKFFFEKPQPLNCHMWTGGTSWLKGGFIGPSDAWYWARQLFLARMYMIELWLLKKGKGKTLWAKSVNVGLLCIALHTDYGQTMAKSIILYSPNSYSNPK